MSRWIATASRKPMDSREVSTLSPNGMRQTLRYRDNLWWAPDFSMYVYYTPEFWMEEM